jgi:LCP family protein required for cell wall assembly
LTENVTYFLNPLVKKSVFIRQLKRFSQRLTPQQIGFGLVLLALFLISALATYFFGQWQRITVTPTVVPASPSPSPVDMRYAHLFNQGNAYSVLLMGYGGGAHEGGKLTDSMILVHLDPKLQQATLISLPRDIWVGLPVVEGQESFWKINAAYAIGADDRRYSQKPAQFTGEAGGGELAKYAVEKVTGIHVDKFMTLDFYGFTKTIDTLGGVTVRVERVLDDPFYPIEGEEQNTCGISEAEIEVMMATMSASVLEQSFPCRYEHLVFEPGKQLMTGETALKYVRSRHGVSDGGDFSRAARQRNLILAVKERVLALNFLPKAIPFTSSLAGSLTTDVTLSDMENYLKFQEEIKGYTIHSLAVTDKNILRQARSSDGQFILQPQAGDQQWPAVHDWIKQQLASPSASRVESATQK